MSSSFVIVTTGDLPEAYFLALFLLGRSQRVAMVNIVARPLREQLSQEKQPVTAPPRRTATKRG